LEEEYEPVVYPPETSSTDVNKTSTAKKSKNKKKKRKSNKDETPHSQTPTDTPSTPPHSTLDDVDRAIQEISQKYGDAPSPSSSLSNPSITKKYSLLSVSPKFLDADLELRKLFGKIVDLEARESRRQPIHGVPARVLNRIKATQTQRKHTLMKPKDEWQLFSAYNKSMLSMDIIEKEGVVTKFKLVHSRRYQEIQMQFFITALGGDGNVLMGLLQQHPFHVDTWYYFQFGTNLVFKLVRC
jgi:Transcriptional repressor TCF25